MAIKNIDSNRYSQGNELPTCENPYNYPSRPEISKCVHEKEWEQVGGQSGRFRSFQNN